MIIYLSGPMSGIKDYNYPRFNEVAGLLRAQGHEVLNPAENKPEPPTYENFMAMSLEQVEACDVVVLMEGMISSPGVADERNHAIKHGKEIMLIEQFGISPKWKGVAA